MEARTILAPLPGRSSAVDRLAAGGRIIPARLDLLELGPPSDVPREMTLSEALEEQRRAQVPLLSLGESDDEDVEALWAEEAERRYLEIERGEVTVIPSPDVLRDARARLK
jgi:hypothetical protein